MAASKLPKPGSQFGPCTTACVHRDCAAMRRQAEATCHYCKRAIGYDVRMYSEDATPANKRYALTNTAEQQYVLVHARCLEARLERAFNPSDDMI